METKRTNYFARVLILVLSFFIAGIIIYNLFFASQKGQINSNIVALIAILVVVVLSESFDNFSVGQFLSLSREKKEKDTELKRVASENIELRSQLIKVVTSVNQNQSTWNLIGASDGLIKSIVVGKASLDEVQEKELQKAERQEDVERPSVRRTSQTYSLNKMEEFAINDFVKKNLDGYSVLRDAKLIPTFQGIDPISDIQPIFDGYINTGQEEIFIEVLRNNRHAFMRRDRYYLMLTKLYLYRSIKKNNAYLVLIKVNLPEDKDDIFRGSKVENQFEPAMSNGLLRIVEINVSSKDAKLLIDNEQQRR